MPLLIPYSLHGEPLGEHHHRAKLSDRDIELIHDLKHEGLTSYQVAEKMGCSFQTVRSIWQHRRRAPTTVIYKPVTL